MTAITVLLLGIDKGTARSIEADCQAHEISVEYSWPTSVAPALCIAHADIGHVLFDIRAKHPDCLLAVFGEPPSHAYPNEAIWLRHPIRNAALTALIEMISTPNPLDEAELEELRTIFWQRYQHDLSMFETWLQRGELTQLKRIGHQLAGSAGTLGYPTLALVGRRLEDAASSENLMYLRSAYAELARYARE